MGGRAAALGADFRHLFEVAARALRHGDRRPAEVLLRSYRAEAARLAAAGPQAGLRVVARDKARRLARLLGAAPLDVASLPNPERDPPPAFAAAKRRPRDPLVNMRLSPRQAAAAEEIRAVFEATVRRLMARGHAFDNTRVDAGRVARDPFDGMPPELARKRRLRYLPWVERSRRALAGGRRGAPGGDRFTLVDLVLSVLVDRVPIRALERRHGAASGAFSPPFKAALDDYFRGG
jgi:hypothetical protein